MAIRNLTIEIARSEEYQIWNSFIDILAMESEENLSDIQKHAQRAFWYESEIQNGGHLQYFENQKMESYCEVIHSLKIIGAIEHAMVLQKATDMLLSKKRKPIITLKSFIKKALENEYGEYDSEYYDINPDMNYYLENYLNKFMDEFIRIE